MATQPVDGGGGRSVQHVTSVSSRAGVGPISTRVTPGWVRSAQVAGTPAQNTSTMP